MPRGVEGVFLDVGHHHVHAAVEEGPGERQPDAAGRAGDERRLALELLHASSLQWSQRVAGPSFRELFNRRPGQQSIASAGVYHRGKMHDGVEGGLVIPAKGRPAPLMRVQHLHPAADLFDLRQLFGCHLPAHRLGVLLNLLGRVAPAITLLTGAVLASQEKASSSNVCPRDVAKASSASTKSKLSLVR